MRIMLATLLSLLVLGLNIYMWIGIWATWSWLFWVQAGLGFLIFLLNWDAE